MKICKNTDEVDDFSLKWKEKNGSSREKKDLKYRKLIVKVLSRRDKKIRKSSEERTVP